MSAADYQTIFNEWLEIIEISGRPNEWEVKTLINKVGLKTPAEFLLRADVSMNDPAFLEFIDTAGGPFAIKLCSADVLHKTDVGGVKLGVSAENLPVAIMNFRSRFGTEHLLISCMVSFSGPEFILGAVSDPVLGPAIMTGAGGILTELYKDVSFRLAPCSTAEAGYMLEELTIAPVLKGYRGSTMNIESLKHTVCVFSRLAAVAVDSGAQLDINPLVWDGAEWVALDAKAVLV